MIKEIVGLQYPYSKVKEIISKTLSLKEKGKIILIIGQPGSGKSMFMSQLYAGFKDKVECLTAIRAEFLNEADSSKNVYELFERVKHEDKIKVLLLDSLDVLAYSRRRELQEWLFYLDKLKNIKGMTVICASRSFEAEHLYPMSEQKWSEKILIEPLPDDFIDKVLNKLRYDITLITPRFREFLRTPLHLRIAADIIKKGADPTKTPTLQGLYARLFETLQISTAELNLLAVLADKMIEDRTTQLSYPSLNIQLFNSIKGMERPGITGLLQIDSENKRLSFSHQTLIDYLVAWKVINESKPLLDFVMEHKQNLFIRPVIRHILGFLRSGSESRLFEELGRLFFEENIEKKIGFELKSEKIKMHIKSAILANLASWDKPTVPEGKFLLRIFEAPSRGQILMTQFFNSNPDSDWFNVLRDIFIIPVIENRNEQDLEYRTVLSFLSTIAADLPEGVLNIALKLLEKKPNTHAEWFYNRISDNLDKIPLDSQLQEKFSNLLEQAVRKRFVCWYYEIQRFCRRITKFFPERALCLYLDFLKEELTDKNKKIISSQGSLTESFDKVLPEIHNKIPYQTLFSMTEFFESIFSKDAQQKKVLWDYPMELLYAEHPQRFGLEAMYYWYKNKVLVFCSQISHEGRMLINKLEKSRWETQQQLSMLCKTQIPREYKQDLLKYLQDILRSNLEDNSMFGKSEVFLRVLEATFPVLSSSKREEIINKLIALNFEDSLKAKVWIWKPLHHIPEKIRTQKVKDRLQMIKKKFNFKEEYKYTSPIKSTGIHKAETPISRDELKKKPPEELLVLLVKNRDLKERWDWDKDKFFGGVRELAQEVAGVLTEDLEKYKKIIFTLAKDPLNDEYIMWLFCALSQKEVDKKSIDWLIGLILSIYQREKLQLEIVRFLRKIAEVISEEQFHRLKPVIEALSEAKDPERDRFFKYREQGYSNDALTEGINSVRGTVAELLLELIPKFKENWYWLCNILENLANDKTISVRATLVSYLPFVLKPLGWDKCFEIFNIAFKKGPEEYSKGITGFLRYVPKDKFNGISHILAKIEDSKAGPLGKTYALLNAIYYFRRIYDESKLLSIFEDKSIPESAKEECFNLIANQVKYKENVDCSIKVINDLLEKDVLRGNLSLLFIEAKTEDLNKLVPVIERTLTRPFLRGQALYYMLEYLEKCLLINPLKVFSLLEKMLEDVGDNFYNIREYIPASHSKAPLNIINTILECYPEFEERALKALDKLIELHWEGVDDYLKSFDRL